MFRKPIIALALTSFLTTTNAFAGFEMVEEDKKPTETNPVQVVTEQQENQRLKAELDKLSAQVRQLKEELEEQKKLTERLDNQQPLDLTSTNEKAAVIAERIQQLAKIIVPFASGSTQFVAHPVTTDYLLASARSATQISIVGFTDSTGTRSTNLRVSRRRAEAVKAYLVSQQIDESKISTEGRVGEYVASNSTRAGRLANRRVEIEFK